MAGVCIQQEDQQVFGIAYGLSGWTTRDVSRVVMVFLLSLEFLER